jgi:adenylate cyclase
VGDIVNTASRIEGLNKLLGTRILVSADTLEGVTGLATRELGTFLLAGKQTPVVIHELLGTEGSLDAGTLARHARFAAALVVFRGGDWAGAGVLFDELAAASPGDGAARFYRDTCTRYRESGADTFRDGAIRLASK